MLSKGQVSFFNSLQQKKNRKELGLFVAEGEKIINELLASSFVVRKIAATEAYIDEYLSKLPGSSVEIIPSTETELKKISSLSTPNRCVAIAEIPAFKMEEE